MKLEIYVRDFSLKDYLFKEDPNFLLPCKREEFEPQLWGFVIVQKHDAAMALYYQSLWSICRFFLQKSCNTTITLSYVGKCYDMQAGDIWQKNTYPLEKLQNSIIWNIIATGFMSINAAAFLIGECKMQALDDSAWFPGFNDRLHLRGLRSIK